MLGRGLKNKNRIPLKQYLEIDRPKKKQSADLDVSAWLTKSRFRKAKKKQIKEG
jgi:hypothetical protein